MSFIYVGRLYEIKGIKLLFEAWQIMGREAPSLKVCGSGPLENWCHEYIKKNELDSITMTGKITNIRAKELMAESEALIAPSLWYEGFPMTIIEAYSVGTPVISSDLGNAGSIVEEGITGWKFKAGSAEGLVEKVKGWGDISESVKTVYEKKYTSEMNYFLLLNVYEMVQEICVKY